VTSKPDFKVMILLLVFMQLTHDLFAIAKFLLMMMMMVTMLVRSGWLEQNDVCLIPDELRPEFNVAVDARGATADEWTDLRLMYCRAARQYDFSTINGYHGRPISRLC